MDLEAGQMRTRDEDSAAIFKNVNRPVTLQFEDLVYKVEIGGSKGWLSKTTKSSEKKVILKGINGIVRPGEMLAMMGPSGSGKTTLLTALGGRLGEGKLTGSITYNGKPFSNKMNRNTGFVTQDDVLYPHLTVIETLVFTALLRLPNNFTAAQKADHAEAVVKQLGLTRCKNSIIGGPFLRGISGGERKRVSIGQEMLINPSLLFLDEPTSGLDSTTAQRIVSTLSELVTGGRTCLMTIHQPSSRLFYMFHKVLLLSEGNPVYFGEGSAAMEYFSDIGFTPSVAMNPADYLLDLANGVTGDDSQQDPATIKQTLVTAFKSNVMEKLKDELKKSSGSYHEGTEERDVGGWPTTWFQQFTVLLRRGVKERRHQAFSGLKIGQILFVALLSGFLWWQSDDSHLQDKIGLLFFYSGFWGFYPLFQAIFTFPQERMMLAKERTSRMYRLSSYFISRVVGDLPLELALPTAFVLITYFMSGLKPYAVNFLATLFSLLLSVLVAQGLGLALGAMVMDQKSATTLGSVIMLSFLLSGGYYVQHVPAFIAWVQYLSISGYSYKLFLDSQYKYSDTYPCTTDPSGHCLVGEFPAIKHVGLGSALVSVIVLVVMLFGYRAVAYVALTRIGRTNKIG